MSCKEKTRLIRYSWLTTILSPRTRITSMRKWTMSALLLSTACMRGLWPLLMSWFEKKSTMGNVSGCRDGKFVMLRNFRECWLSAAHGLTMALMSAPASSSILAKSLWSRSTARWRALKPENRDKAESKFWANIDVGRHIQYTDTQKHL